MRDFVKKNAVNGLLGVLLIGVCLLVIANFVITPMNVDGRSMEPTLSDNQRIWINQLAYNDGEAEYGDVVVVLNASENNETKMVKRVYGKPNDVIEFRDNVLYRNDVAVENIVLPEDFDGSTGFGEPVELEAGQYYLLGDNLSESSDSRQMGAIDYANFIGKVLFK